VIVMSKETLIKSTQQGKLKILQVDIGGCEGCAVNILRSLPLIKDDAELVSSYLVDEELPTSVTYDMVFITGSVCINDHHVVELVKKLRGVGKVVISFGSCATFGGITRFCRGGQEPRPEHRTYQPVSHVIDVDYAIPGCPPPPQFLRAFITAFKRGITHQLRVFKAAAKVKKLSGFDLLDDVVLPGLCMGCGACELSCPTGAIYLVNRRPDLIVEKCIRCGSCYIRCPRASQILVGRYT